MVVLRSASVGEVYEEHRDEDGFLYVQFSGENTFGLADCLWITFADCFYLSVDYLYDFCVFDSPVMYIYI